MNSSCKRGMATSVAQKMLSTAESYYIPFKELFTADIITIWDLCKVWTAHTLFNSFGAWATICRIHFPAHTPNHLSALLQSCTCILYTHTQIHSTISLAAEKKIKQLTAQELIIWIKTQQVAWGRLISWWPAYYLHNNITKSLFLSSCLVLFVPLYFSLLWHFQYLAF